ncbi:NYN domain-containing protein (plasmid) [Roseomonas gilardii subsp. gilardii]|uniref:NYN domain-containing protein n=1 Tax=Roseomonas gilardii TaxID=257708 RepID=UPI001FF738C5|nr:NYN domain-containing protein [Roseomonas gilardii]UPG74697.1 NYN domain-containing protein [Roseomonas gilardii subsp. gilardii]
MERRVALFVDFDNVFSALCLQAPEAAEIFVAEPGHWLDWIAQRDAPQPGRGGTDRAVQRRILVRRCYLNPVGSLVLPDGERVFFGSFRDKLVRAGFQITDCPPLTRGGKTSADIVLVMDVLDALSHATRFDEFVLVSSDADFTPVLQRLRAHDRRTTVVAVGNAAEAYRAAADEVVGSEVFIGQALGWAPERRDPPAPQAGPPMPGGKVPAPIRDMPDAASDPAAAREAILSLVLEELSQSPAPLHLPALGKRLQARLGSLLRSSAYGGAGSLARLIATAGDPRLKLIPGPGGGWLRDPFRHPSAPEGE